VQLRTARRRYVLEDRPLHDRRHEGERAARSQQLSVHQAVDGAVRRVRFDVGEVNYGRDVTQFAVNGTCFEEVTGGRRQAIQSHEDLLGDPRYGQTIKVTDHRGARRNALVATGLREFDNELRPAARRVELPRRRTRVRFDTELGGQDDAHTLEAQRRQ